MGMVVRTAPEETSFSGLLTLDAMPSGHPIVALKELSSSVVLDKVQTLGHGWRGIGWYFARQVKNDAPGVLRNLTIVMPAWIRDVVQPWLEGQPVSEKLPLPAPFDVVSMNLGLTAVEITDHSMDVFLDGSVVNASDAGTAVEVKESAISLPEPTHDSNSMANIVMSQRIINNILNKLHERSLFRVNISDEDIPTTSDVHLNTDAFDEMLPKLSIFPCAVQPESECSAWGLRSMRVEARTLQTPTIKFAEGHFLASARARFDMYVLHRGLHLLALSVSTLLKRRATPVVEWRSGNYEVNLRLGELKVHELTVERSNVGAPMASFGAWAVEVLTPLSDSIVHEVLSQQGITSPVGLLPLAFQQSEIVVLQDAMELSTDFALELTNCTWKDRLELLMGKSVTWSSQALSEAADRVLSTFFDR